MRPWISKVFDVRADAGHGVAHQHEAVVPLGAQRDLQHFGMHVMPIDDEPDPAVRVRERRADGAGFARC